MNVYYLPRGYGAVEKVRDPASLSVTGVGDTVVVTGVIGEREGARWAVAIGQAVVRGAAIERRL